VFVPVPVPQSVLALYAATSLNSLGGGEEGGEAAPSTSTSTAPHSTPADLASTGSSGLARTGVAATAASTSGQHTSTNGASSSSASAAKAAHQPAPSLTGVVVDVGEGTTSVVPVVDGYVVRAGVRSMPLGGRDVTNAVMSALR
jgi:actin-related protein